MDQFEKEIETSKQELYNAGYVDAYRDIFDAVQQLTVLKGRQLYHTIDQLFDHVQSVIARDGKEW